MEPQVTSWRPGLLSRVALPAPVWLLATSLSAAIPGAGIGPGERPDSVLVYAGGQDGYHTFRIPSAIVTPKGTLLAFGEGRKNGGGDAGDVDLVLKRSTDGGRTWGKLGVVWDDQGNTCGNPCPIVDRETGTILLLMTHNLGADGEARI